MPRRVLVPQLRHARKWTQVSPSATHSSHTVDVGSTDALEFRCEHAVCAAFGDMQFSVSEVRSTRNLRNLVVGHIRPCKSDLGRCVLTVLPPFSAFSLTLSRC